MASPTSHSGRRSSKTPPTPDRRRPLQNDPPEVVDPVWLVKAIGLTILAALICGYLSLCLLFYQGQWQFILHPSQSSVAPTDIAGTPIKTIRFGVDETASPQLTGWLIPAAPSARYAAYTLLYLPSGDGSLVNAIPSLSALHQVGINVFAFDYRGYGQSAPVRPNQKRMTEDAANAWRYLTVSRSIPPSHLILFGTGTGCALAAQLAAAHPEAPAVILDSPRPNLIRGVLADPRTSSLPVRSLFNQTFDIIDATRSLKSPKLFLVSSDTTNLATDSDIALLTSKAASPKFISTLTVKDINGPTYQAQIVRFLDQYLH